MRANSAIVGGRVATVDGVLPATVVITGGKVSALLDPEERPDANDIVDARGKIIIPGGIDPHVHFNEPGRSDWEGFETGTLSAAAGGITTVIEMPLNANPPTTDEASFALKWRTVRDKAVVDYALWGGVVTDNVDALEGLHRSGVVGYKAFMIDTQTEFTRAEDGVLWEAMQRIAAWGSVLGVHAENNDLATRLQRRLRQEGRRDMRAWCEGRPPIVELEAIQRALLLARAAGCRLHVVHLSLPEGADAIAEARRADVRVTVETCPQYLLLDEEMFVRLGPVAKCAPPLRPREILEGLWRRVLSGGVDCLSSDHSPCPPAEKLRGIDNVWDAWGGITGVQTLLPLVVSEGVHRRGLSLERFVALTSTHAARIFGLYPQKGSLLPGSDADVVILDLDREWTLTESTLLYRHRWTPYLGWKIKGRVDRVMVRGRTVVEDGEVVGKPGDGKLVLPAGTARPPRA